MEVGGGGILYTCHYNVITRMTESIYLPPTLSPVTTRTKGWGQGYEGGGRGRLYTGYRLHCHHQNEVGGMKGGGMKGGGGRGRLYTDLPPTLSLPE